MKVSKINQSLLLASLLLCFCSFVAVAQSRRAPTAQAPPPPPRPIAAEAKSPAIKVDVNGHFNGPAYTNEALGFALTLPQGWQVQDTGVQQQFAEKASQATVDASSNKAAMQASVARTTLLFITIKPTEGRINPLVVGITEDISLVFSVRTIEQYIESLRRAGEVEGSPLRFDEKMTIEEIGGVKFGVIGAGPRNPETALPPSVGQRYYVTLRKNHALTFILTYDGAAQLQACREILNSLKFQ
jgi:hypothetical protein